MSTDTKTLSERLRHTATTAANDDCSKPMTDERRRYIDRVDMMLEAAVAIDAQDALLREAAELCGNLITAITEDRSLRGDESGDDKWFVDRARALLSKLTEATKP